jgi:preprotein translocase subunit SecE
MLGFGKVKRFFGDVVIELKKTTWPSRKDVIGLTIVVIVMVAVVSAFLWVVDLGLSRLLEIIFRVTA